MMKSFFKNKQTFFLLILEVLLTILAALSLIDDVFFLTTKKEAYAELIKVERLKLPDPYKVTLSYFNEFENKRIVTFIDDIDGLYGQKLIPKNYVKIYYKDYFPKQVCFIDYKSPNIGTVFLSSMFLLIMLLAVYFSWKKLVSNNA